MTQTATVVALMSDEHWYEILSAHREISKRFTTALRLAGAQHGGEKMGEVKNAYARVEVEAYSGNCHKGGAIELYQGEPYMNLYVTGGDKRSGVTMQTRDAIKLRDALNEKFPGYAPAPAKSYKAKVGYNGYQIVRTETKTETKDTVVAHLSTGATPSEVDNILAAVRANAK